MSTPPETAYTAEPILPHLADSALAATPTPSSPNNPPWGVVSGVLTWLTSLALIFVVPNICILPYLAYRFRGVALPSKEVLLSDTTLMFLYVLGWLPAHLLTLALIWAVATRMGRYSIRDVFGWNWSPNFGFWKSVALALSLFILTLFLIGLFGGQKTDLDRILESSRAAAVTLAIIAVATAPLVEEMIYRGLLYSALQRAIGQWLTVFVVTSMFAGLHVVQYWPNLGAISSITLLSLVLTMIRARTGRLLPCFVIHLVFNGVQSLIIVLEPYLRALFELWHHEPVNAQNIFLHLLG